VLTLAKGSKPAGQCVEREEVRFCEPQFVQGCAKIKLAVLKVNTCYRVVLGGRLQIKQISENYVRAIR
jgi:hypothetical protein